MLSARPRARCRALTRVAAVGCAAMAVVPAAPVAAAAPASAPQLPAGIRVSPSASIQRINGVEIRVWALASALPPARACALLASHWREAGAAPLAACQAAGPWLVVSHPLHTRAQTIQLRLAGEGSEGYLSELDLAARPSARPRPNVPLPPGARVLSAVQSIDAGDAVSQYTLALGLPPAIALRQLASLAQSQRWSVAPHGAGHVLDLQRGWLAVRAIATPRGGGSQLVLIEHAAGPPRR